MNGDWDACCGQVRQFAPTLGDTGVLDDLVVSAAGGTRLRATRDGWVLIAGGTSAPIEHAIYGLLPLLERDPGEVVAAVAALDGPPFPYEDVLAEALASDSGYWQEQAVPWLHVLDLEPVGDLAQVARRTMERKLASQQHRQQLHLWLLGKPMRHP